jgi:DNA polymerase-3 subunit epsilon
MKIIKFFYDLETTGASPVKNDIHQIAGLIEINGEVVERFDIKTKPHRDAIVEPEALKVGGVTLEQIMRYQTAAEARKQLLTILSKYIDRFNPKQKAFLIGFNNRSFDDVFLRAWFERQTDPYFGAWFWSDSLDVLVLASQYLIERRAAMASFKLKAVAAELGLEVDEAKLHDGAYDIGLTRQIYRIVTGLDFEI